MAKKSLLEKMKKESRFEGRKYYRCQICGRSGGYLRRYKVCRICFRTLALRGELPGVVKASW